MKKKLLLAFIFSLPLLAQSANLNFSCANTARAGSNLACSISLAGGSLPAGLQWTLVSSSPVGTVTVTPAAAAMAAQKTMSCNASNTCLLTGINAGQIADGTLANLSIPIPAAPSIQTLSLGLSSAVGVSLAASAIPTTTNPSTSVSIFSGCDINGDGQINAADVAAQQTSVLAIPQTAADLNQDGKLDVMDVQIVINAARGFACGPQ